MEADFFTVNDDCETCLHFLFFFPWGSCVITALSSVHVTLFEMGI